MGDNDLYPLHWPGVNALATRAVHEILATTRVFHYIEFPVPDVHVAQHYIPAPILVVRTPAPFHSSELTRHSTRTLSFKFMCGTMGWVCARSTQFPRAWSLGCTPAS
jgi:hypothetical protein